MKNSLMLRRNREAFQRNNEIIPFFLYFCTGITPVRRNSKELITSYIPAKTNMFHVAGT